MVRFEPKYISYQNRILNGLIGILVAVLILTIALFFSGIKQYLIAAIVVFGVLFIWRFYLLVQRSKKYLKSIVITQSEIEIVIVEKDKELVPLISDLENIRIKVVQLFFNFNHWGRNYKLQIDIKRNGKFETILEQYEIGKWNLNVFKEIYTAYCKTKNIPYSLTSLKRINF